MEMDTLVRGCAASIFDFTGNRIMTFEGDAAFPEKRKEISENCVECRLCLADCRFLQRHGSPKQIADRYAGQKHSVQQASLACSLCRLCTAVCPKHLDPAEMFLEIRREAVRENNGVFAGSRAVLRYEAIGTSAAFTWYGLPKGCDTVMFPGCAFAGTRPDRTIQIFQYMRKFVPNIGIVLDCCTKPSHDMGRQSAFLSMFGEMRNFLLASGVRNVFVSCPNCYNVFKQYGEKIRVKTLYQFFSTNGLRYPETVDATVVIHDPCTFRFESGIQADIRALVRKTGLTIQPMDHEKINTICCGEGGDVPSVDPDLADRWGRMRKQEAGRHRMITYCAGCAAQLERQGPAGHVLDLLFDPQGTAEGSIRTAKAPFTYLNRLRLKRYFKRTLQADITRVRPPVPGRPETGWRFADRLASRFL